MFPITCTSLKLGYTVHIAWCNVKVIGQTHEKTLVKTLKIGKAKRPFHNPVTYLPQLLQNIQVYLLL